MSKYNLHTGDILLFDTRESGILGIFNYIIKKFTKSNYSHVAMVLKDPEFIHPSLKGYYIWDGNIDTHNGKIKLDVQITPFHEIYDKCYMNGNSIYVRHISESSLFTNKNLSKIHNIAYNNPYDIIPDLNLSSKTKLYWCSSLIGYIYTICGILNSSTNWSALLPSDFSTKSNVLNWVNPLYLSEEIQLL